MTIFSVKQLSGKEVLRFTIDSTIDEQEKMSKCEEFLKELSNVRQSCFDKLVVGNFTSDLREINRHNLTQHLMGKIGVDDVVEMDIVIAINGHVLEYISTPPQIKAKIYEILPRNEYQYLTEDKRFILSAIKESKYFCVFELASDEIKRDQNFILNELLPVLNEVDLVDYYNVRDALEVHRSKMGLGRDFGQNVRSKLEELKSVPSAEFSSPRSEQSFHTARSK